VDLPPDIRRSFQRHGRRGGRVRARRLSPDRRRAIARDAALRRWIRARFGASSFEALGLPAGAAVDRGITDLAAERETNESLLVSLASSRLIREGVPLPSTRFSDADHRLYRRLEREHGELGHARYLAWVEQIVSFADACSTVREG
jgi:hypothetical protein